MIATTCTTWSSVTQSKPMFSFVTMLSQRFKIITGKSVLSNWWQKQIEHKKQMPSLQDVFQAGSDPRHHGLSLRIENPAEESLCGSE